MGYDNYKTRSPDDDLYHCSAWDFADEPAEKAKAQCTCQFAANVHPTDIDMPDFIVDPHCPVHGDGGSDPDEACERKRDEATE